MFLCPNARWPWRLFQLLYGALSQPSDAKKKIAMNLLAADEEMLEHNTRKLRRLCTNDLKHTAATGCLQEGCLLHAILGASAQNLCLDSGELESLNSMIKTAASTYTNMSLELLSARVNVRKTLTLSASGNHTFAEFKGIATSLANASTLYQGMEREALDESLRWAPPAPEQNVTPYKPLTVDPCIQLSKAQKWAVKYNSMLMKKMLEMARDTFPTSWGFSIDHTTHQSVFVSCELAGRTCQALLLEPKVSHSDAREAGSVVFMVPSRLVFTSSLDAIAGAFEDLCRPRQTMELTAVRLKMCAPCDGQCGHFSAGAAVSQLHYTIVASDSVATMRRRKEYTRRSTDGDAVNEPHAAIEGSIDAEPEGPEEDEDDESMADLLDEIEQELCGDFANDADDAEWMADEQCEDLNEMEKLHNKFVAAAADRQHSAGSASSSRAEHQPEADYRLDERQYEDGVGEHILEQFMQGEGLAASSGASGASGSAESIRHVDIDISADIVDQCLHRWTRRLDGSLEACAEMARQLKAFEVDRLDTCLNAHLALLICDGGSDDTADVAFVSWVKPFHELQGRLVSLDESSAVIFPSNFRAKTQFAGSFVVIPNTGVRVRKKGRDIVSSSMLRLQTMFQTGLDASAWMLPDTLSDEVVACAACGNDMSVSPLRRCACCLMYWHDSCNSKVGDRAAGFLVAEEVPGLTQRDLVVADLPFTFLPKPQAPATV